LQKQDSCVPQIGQEQFAMQQLEVVFLSVPWTVNVLLQTPFVAQQHTELSTLVVHVHSLKQDSCVQQIGQEQFAMQQLEHVFLSV